MNQKFADAHQSASALIQLKTQLFANGYTVQSEAIQGDAVVCTFVEPTMNTTVVTTQNVKDFSIHVEQQ